jgi:Flp pilus assembly protein TadG
MMLLKSTSKARRGTIVVLSALLIVFLMIMVAFAVDMGYVLVVRTQLQNAADAAAMAGCSKLLDQSVLTGSPSTSTFEASARAEAQRLSGANYGGGVSLSIADNPSNGSTGDIVCGYLSNPSNLDQSLDTSSTTPNSVQVRVRRDSTTNGSLGLFFARVMGINSTSLTATATATYRDHISGFSIHTPGYTTCKLLPFALDVNTWNSVLAGNGPDNFSRDPSTGAVTSGSDNIHECKLYPLSNGAGGKGKNALPPGNFGTVDIGAANNSTADLARQIVYGPNASDLAHFPNGVCQLDPTTHVLLLNGDTGVSAGVKDELASIIGQPRIIPLYSSVSGPGNNAVYTIVGWAGITITEVVLTGSLSSKHLTIQPCFCIDANALPGTLNSSTYVYTPVALTR